MFYVKHCESSSTNRINAIEKAKMIDTLFVVLVHLRAKTVQGIVHKNPYPKSENPNSVLTDGVCLAYRY